MAQRTWFITGVSSGFGREMAVQLLERGDRVAGTVRRADAVEDLKAKYGDLFWLAQLDVTDTPGIKRVVDKAFADLGRIEVIVNNAGYGLFGAAEELTDEQIQHQIDTNLLGSIQVVRAALPHLRAQGGGRIIQLSSYSGQTAGPGACLYSASKWGIEGFLEGTLKDVAPFNIGVTIVEPGGANTEFRTGSVKLGEKLDTYKNSPARMTRGFFDAPPPAVGDPAKMVRIMIDSADQNPAPRRLVLGKDAYGAIHAALKERLAEVEAQKELAYSTDFDPAN